MAERRCGRLGGDPDRGDFDVGGAERCDLPRLGHRAGASHGGTQETLAVRASHPRAWRRGHHDAGVARYLRRQDEARGKSPSSSRTTCDELPEPRYDHKRLRNVPERDARRSCEDPRRRRKRASGSRVQPVLHACARSCRTAASSQTHSDHERSCSDRPNGGGTHEPPSGMRVSVLSAKLVTHTAPKPIATAVGVPPTLRVSSSRPVRGSSMLIVPGSGWRRLGPQVTTHARPRANTPSLPSTFVTARASRDRRTGPQARNDQSCCSSGRSGFRDLSPRSRAPGGTRRAGPADRTRRETS